MTTISEELTPNSSLDALATQFSDWRASRANRRTSVPEDLRNQALELLKSYRKSHVIKALGINSNMLKNWQERNVSLLPSNTFISLKTETSPTTPIFELTLTYSQGDEIRLKGDFSLAQLTAFAQGFRPGKDV